MAENIIKPSPFLYHGNDEIVYEPMKNSKVKSLRSLFEQRMLLKADGRILYYIDKYAYLNAYLIRSLLSLETECSPEFCKNRLNHLVKLGLLTRFRTMHSDSFGKKRGSVYFYQFTEKGRSLFAKTNVATSKEYEDVSDAGDVLRRVAYNQLHIMLYIVYGPNCVNQLYHYGKTYYDGHVRFTSNGKEVSFHILTLRANCTENWKELFNARLFESQRQKLPPKSFLVLCETELQALEAEKYRKCIAELTGLNICYLCDYSTNSVEGVFSKLILVKPENNYSEYDICNIPIDGQRTVMNIAEEE